MWFMAAIDEQGRPIVHAERPNEHHEREQWVIILDADGRPDTLVQEYATPNAHFSGAAYVRRGRTVHADEFFTAELANEVRSKLYKYIQNHDAPDGA
jgi:hypothetical protein